MTIAVEQFTPDASSEWDEFVMRSANGTIQHTRRFLSYHPEGRWDDRSLIIRDGQRMVGLLPAARVDRAEGTILLSHPGASYGGLVTPPRARFASIQAMLGIIEEDARREGFDRLEMRHSPAAVRQCENGQLDFALTRNGYRRAAEELATFYRLADFAYVDDFDGFISSFPSDARRGIRKGTRSLTTRVLELSEIERFHQILTATLAARYDRAPVHSVDEMKTLMTLFPGEVFAFGVFSGDELVGGYFVFCLTPRTMHIFYAALDYTHQEHRPLDFGLAKLIHLAHQQGRAIVNYGISTEDGGRTVNHGLLRFKEGFGGRGSVRTTWVKDL